MIERFGPAMRENIANGEIPSRKAYPRSVIDRIEVDDQVVRIIGDWNKLWPGKASPRPGGAVWYASGAPEEIRTPEPPIRSPVLRGPFPDCTAR
jgi:hypothetical protein